MSRCCAITGAPVNTREFDVVAKIFVQFAAIGCADALVGPTSGTAGVGSMDRRSSSDNMTTSIDLDEGNTFSFYEQPSYRDYNFLSG